MTPRQELERWARDANTTHRHIAMLGLSLIPPERKKRWPVLLTFPRPADFTIEPVKGKPYLKRWWIIPRNKFGFNVYLHQILRSDDDRALHDHPWRNISIILKGGYWEHMPGGKKKWRRPGSIIFRKATDAHRLELKQYPCGLCELVGDMPCLEPITVPCWSLFLTGKWQRVWGFHCPQGFKPWRKFIGIADGVEARGDEIGPGCADA